MIQSIQRITDILTHLGVSENDLTILHERLPTKKGHAYVAWYLDGKYCFVSSWRHELYRDNLQEVMGLLDHDMHAIDEGNLTVAEWIASHEASEHIIEQRHAARELLGVPQTSNDFAAITAQYKELAKTLHPDVGGDAEQYKNVTAAFDVIKRELA